MLTPPASAPPLYDREEDKMMTRSFSSEYADQVEAVKHDSGRLSLDNMIRNDKLVINTNNSAYRFVFSDPVLRQGVLSGGALGDAQRSAILIGSIMEGADGGKSEIPGLKVGARAVFYLISPAGMERLITSAVINLTLIKGGKTLPLVTDSADRMLLSQCLMPA